MDWIRAEDKRPKIGQVCLVCFNGVVQNETYVYDGGDECQPFWARDELDRCPEVEDSDLWMPLPSYPTPIPQAESWKPHAVKWIREKAKAQQKINDDHPRHAACYPSWAQRVYHIEQLALELEKEVDE